MNNYIGQGFADEFEKIAKPLFVSHMDMFNNIIKMCHRDAKPLIKTIRNQHPPVSKKNLSILINKCKILEPVIKHGRKGLYEMDDKVLAVAASNLKKSTSSSNNFFQRAIKRKAKNAIKLNEAKQRGLIG